MPLGLPLQGLSFISSNPLLPSMTFYGWPTSLDEGRGWGFNVVGIDVVGQLGGLGACW